MTSTALSNIAAGYVNHDREMVSDVVLPRRIVTAEAAPEDAHFETHAVNVRLRSADVTNAPADLDPLALGVRLATKILLLRREVRVSHFVSDPKHYPPSNVIRFDEAGCAWNEASSRPITALRRAMGLAGSECNSLVLGQSSWTALSSHPEAVGEVGRTFATRAEVARLLGLRRIGVAAEWVNEALPGESVRLTRTWGVHALVFYAAEPPKKAGPASLETFGSTLQLGRRAAVTQVVGDHVVVTSVERLQERIVVPACAVLLRNVLT